MTAVDTVGIPRAPVGGRTLSPSALIGDKVHVEVHRVDSTRDPVHVAALAGGGVISYQQADGSELPALGDTRPPAYAAAR